MKLHDITLESVFPILPGSYLLLAAEDSYRIIGATEAYLQIADRNADIVGKPLFSEFPDNPSDPRSKGVESLKMSLQEVRNTLSVQKLNLLRYDTRGMNASSYETRYWRVKNIPILDINNEMKYILHAVEDVTDRVLLRSRLRDKNIAFQKQISEAISTTQELERIEVSKELHDNVNQILVTARFYLGRVLNKQSFDAHLLQSSFDMLEKAISEIKKLSVALLDTSLEEEDLVKGIEELLGDTLSVGSINIKKEILLPDEVLIESKVKVAIFRIVQEQLTNIIKHSRASTVEIRLQFVDDVLLLMIRDDGQGFDMSERSPGIGLQNMKSRVAIMNGTIDIQSQPGDGCSISVQIPVTDKAPPG